MIYYLAVSLMRQEQNGYANLVLDSELKACKPPLPRGMQLCFRYFLYRAGAPQPAGLMAQFSKRPLEKLDAPVRAILRAGLAQAKFMAVPSPAAVNESVKLAKAFGKPVPRVWSTPCCAARPHWTPSRNIGRIWKNGRAPITVSLSRLPRCLRDSIRRMPRQWPPRFISAAPPPSTTRRTTDEALMQTLQQEGHTVTAGPWPHCLLVMFNGNPVASKAFHAGQFHVQGLASQFAALCCDVHPGMRVLDLCAAQSLTIAEQMQNRGESSQR